MPNVLEPQSKRGRGALTSLVSLSGWETKARKWTNSTGMGAKTEVCRSIISDRASNKACFLPMLLWCCLCVANQGATWKVICKRLSLLPKVRHKRTQNIWRGRGQAEELETHSWFRGRRLTGSRPPILSSIHSICLCVVNLEDNSVPWNNSNPSSHSSSL